MSKHIFAAGEVIVLTPLDTTIPAFRVNAEQIRLVQLKGTTDSTVIYLTGGILKTIDVNESPSALATAAGCLFTCTDSKLGAIYLSTNGVSKLVANGTGCDIFYYQGGIEQKYQVSESITTIAGRINAVTPSGNFVTLDTAQTITGQKTFSDIIIYSSATSIAAAGSTQGTATALTEEYTNVTTGTQLQGVKAVTAVAGAHMVVRNSIGGTPPVTILLYPFSGDAFEGLAADAPVAIPSGWQAEIEAISATTWKLVYTKYSDSAHTGVTAHAGGGQANAVELQGILNTISTVATISDSVKVMALTSYPSGAHVIVQNGGANSVALFPATGEDIGFGVNTSVLIPPAAGIDLMVTPGGWMISDLNGFRLYTEVDGTVTYPAISFADTTTGFYKNSQSQIKVTEGGVEGPAIPATYGYGQMVHRVAVLEYDFAVDGGAQGIIIPVKTATIPDNAFIVKSYYEVLTAPTSATNASKVGVGFTVDDPSAIKTGVAVSNASWSTLGFHDGTQDGAAANFSQKTNAARQLCLSVAVEDLTAGHFIVWAEYAVSV